MRRRRLQIKQQVLVEVIIFRLSNVIARERPNCRLGLPEGQHEKVSRVAFNTTQGISTLVPAYGTVIGNGDGSDDMEVFVGFGSGRSTVPNTSDHTGFTMILNRASTDRIGSDLCGALDR